jgi:hypothetical protein
MTVTDKKAFEVQFRFRGCHCAVLSQCLAEVVCDASWPEGPAMCVRDYAVSCPIGWSEVRGRHGDVECVAPPGCACVCVCVCLYAPVRAPELNITQHLPVTGVCFRYAGCSAVQQFAAMTLEEKQDWARACNVEFPCKGLCLSSGALYLRYRNRCRVQIGTLACAIFVTNVLLVGM